MNHKQEDPGIVQFVRNGLPDGYVVRLASMGERHFPTATKVEKKADGGIEIWFDRIYLDRFAKGQYLEYWRVWKERPKSRRPR